MQRGSDFSALNVGDLGGGFQCGSHCQIPPPPINNDGSLNQSLLSIGAELQFLVISYEGFQIHFTQKAHSYNVHQHVIKTALRKTNCSSLFFACDQRQKIRPNFLLFIL